MGFFGLFTRKKTNNIAKQTQKLDLEGLKALEDQDQALFQKFRTFLQHEAQRGMRDHVRYPHFALKKSHDFYIHELKQEGFRVAFSMEYGMFVVYLEPRVK